jgi:predicted ester cyclase
MSEATPSEVVRRWFEEGWNDGNLDLIDELFSPKFQAEGGPHGTLDRLAYRKYAEAVRFAAPDLHCEVIELLEAGDYVVTRVRSTGTHSGDIEGIKSTGQKVVTEVVDVWKVEEGLIIERCNTEFDTVGLRDQLDRTIRFNPDN